MFGLFGNKKLKRAADLIGVEIHRQLFGALQEDDTVANKNLSSAFTPGYLTGFIWHGFVAQGYDGENNLNKYAMQICDGVLPNGKLYSTFHNQLKALEAAKKFSNKEKIDLFEKGTMAGVYDSGVFNAFFHNEANNLFNYLTNKELIYPHDDK